MSSPSELEQELVELVSRLGMAPGVLDATWSWVGPEMLPFSFPRCTLSEEVDLRGPFPVGGLEVSEA